MYLYIGTCIYIPLDQIPWSPKPFGLYGEFYHVPTNIYIPIDTLEWDIITYIYICDHQQFPI
jgi:hypothetical protein